MVYTLDNSNNIKLYKCISSYDNYKVSNIEDINLLNEITESSVYTPGNIYNKGSVIEHHGILWFTKCFIKTNFAVNALLGSSDIWTDMAKEDLKDYSFNLIFEPHKFIEFD
jgi:hypothetical protein